MKKRLSIHLFLLLLFLVSGKALAQQQEYIAGRLFDSSPGISSNGSPIGPARWYSSCGDLFDIRLPYDYVVNNTGRETQ